MPKRPTPVLEVSNLSLHRDLCCILENITWSVSPREHWTLIGPNGSGKTSLLSILAGYVTPTSGDVRVLGRVFGKCDWRDLRALLGIVSSKLIPSIPDSEPAAHTVFSGKHAQLGLWRLPRSRDIRDAMESLDSVDASHLANRCWGVLSQGERQRVLIARSLIHAPRLLILDEPCAGLDPVARESLLATLQRMAAKQNGPSMALVTHHVEEIVPGFSHALLLKNGSVFRSGPVNEVLRSATLSELFGSKTKLISRNGRFTLQVEPPATPTTATIRPQGR